MMQAGAEPPGLHLFLSLGGDPLPPAPASLLIKQAVRFALSVSRLS